VAELRAAAASVEPAIDPEDARALHPAYAVEIEFAADRPDRMDIALRHRVKAAPSTRPRRGPAALGPLDSYTNRPVLRAASVSTLIPVLRRQARRKLPEYMVPSAFVLLEALPITPNGKVDRGALPAPDPVRAESATHEPARNDVERGIVGVLKELLGADEVGLDDNFFDIGANSLMMVQASVRLRMLFERSVPVVRSSSRRCARSRRPSGPPRRRTGRSSRKARIARG
jgi:hypothetical protein